MKFRSVDGKWYGIDIGTYERGNTLSKSHAQDRLGDILEELFENFKLYEEFPCVPTNLRLDFFIPVLNLAFEFDGEQHDRYVAYFHKDRYGFARSKANDTMKECWCQANAITLIRIKEKDLNKETLEKIIYEQTGE